uniref:Cytochrome P450 n=1 Tax=Dendroctonus armandi TaxID=77159 RepID=A0A0M4HW69_9CUCU|nr:cytochrome P450 [Dendroctonus armandi]
MDASSWTVVLICAILWTICRFKNFCRSMLLALRLPGPPAWPIIGNILHVTNTKAQFALADNVGKFAPFARVWMFLLPTILVYQPDHLRVILSSTKVAEKNFFYQLLQTFIGNGIITSTGDEWRKNRKLLQPMFQLGPIERYFEQFARTSEAVFRRLQTQKHWQITGIVNSCVVSILHKTILGVDLGPKDDTPFRKGQLLIIKRILKPWLLLDSVFQMSEMSRNEAKHKHDLHLYVRKVLVDRKAKLPDTNGKKCFLDNLMELEANGDLSEEDVVNEAVTFMLAGQDSVATGVATCLFYLAKHQEEQRRVHEEIEAILRDSDSQALKLEHVKKMYYLEQCVKETLRLAPSVPLIARVVVKDVTLDGFTIPTGTNIFVSPYATHHLPQIFSDPFKFNPDRFSVDNIKKIHPFGYLPFSIGPRNCIGYKFAYLEMKTMVATILRNYHLQLRHEKDELKLSYRISLRAKGGIWLNVQSRILLQEE